MILTSHGRERYVIADRDYFRHLERAAHKIIATQMKIEFSSTYSQLSPSSRATYPGPHPRRGEDRSEQGRAYASGEDRGVMLVGA
ncbi:MAG: hypothetical protein B7Y36_17265 [Novosphingobium sp. 28-62-57]|uniref:hypothetical protein n=1 Tax=Novosphingobium sp. 28-62-57 TaxID=1970409 RepID=UPI000BDB4F59|nr:hypothetical protein [Novosphingobium sp. 28-62-57]OYZ08243.1 MAG: hypothetical protein B7Y36_17265 [Novosphingobium sp. 28-62-57]